MYMYIPPRRVAFPTPRSSRRPARESTSIMGVTDNARHVSGIYESTQERVTIEKYMAPDIQSV